MAAYDIIDFADLIAAVREELKIQSGDTVSINRIKRDINMVYLNEVVPFTRWKWTEGYTTATLPSVYAEGTCSVTPDSTTVTLSTASPSARGSFAGYKFSVEGQLEIYEIASHTSASTTVTLVKSFNGNLNATAGFKIWTDKAPLPADCRETLKVWHDFANQPLYGRGLQDFREIQVRNPKINGRPTLYYTGDFVDPSTGDGEHESDRYREMLVHPSIFASRVNLHVSYVKQVDALEDAADEPILPVEDRIVILYGALYRAWTRERNPEQAAANRMLFNEKLARMAGKTEDTLDKPKLEPESGYIKSKRGLKLGVRPYVPSGGGGGASFIDVNYLVDVTINGATLINNMTVNTGILIDGRDISEDGADLDAHIAATSAVHGTTGSVVGTTDTQVLTNKTIDADSNTISNIDNSEIKAAAGINVNKLEALTPSKAAVLDSSGFLAASSVDASSLSWLANNEALTSATLTDNISSDTLVASWAHASYTAITLVYSISRGSGIRETGQINIATDGSSAAMAQNAATMGTSGVTFNVDISGANVRLLYQTTSTGSNATMKYKVQKWLA